MLRQRLIRPVRWWVVLVTVVAVLACGGSSAPAAERGGTSAGAAPHRGRMRYYKTMYYDMYTDLDKETVREAATRMTAMGAEYSRRIRGFGVKVSKRLPFYLFRRSVDYYAAGGMPGSTGVYSGVKMTQVVPTDDGPVTREWYTDMKLMAVAAKGGESLTWHTIQHEGFHQFLHAAMQREVPAWLNEGLAEYFGHGIWTGDGFVMGDTPRDRVARIQAQIKLDRMLDLVNLLKMSSEMWNLQMTYRNYDQAWSLVYFLIHGQNGKYHKAFAHFLSDVGRGRAWEVAFVKRFGRDTKAMQKSYNQWWLSRPTDTESQAHATAVVQTLTSFLARAVARRQKIEDFDDFRAKAAAGKLMCKPEQWLPPRLLAGAIKTSYLYKGWQIKRLRVYPVLILTDSKGNVYTGTFTTRSGRAANVAVNKMKPAPRPGRR